MPAKSENQRKLMAMAYAYKKGKFPNASKKVKDIADSMSEEDLQDFAKSIKKEIFFNKTSTYRLEVWVNNTKVRNQKTVITLKNLRNSTIRNAIADLITICKELIKNNSRDFIEARKIRFKLFDEDDLLQSYRMTDPVLYEEKIDEEDPCWDGYIQVGMKNKDGKKVPNCVPESSSGRITEENDSYNDYPDSAKKAAQKALKWREEYGDEVKAGTQVGWQRANQLAKGENLSFDTVKRMAAFVRHKENSNIKPELKDTPWKDNGYVAWLLWGGDSGINWAIKKVKTMKKQEIKEKFKKYVRSIVEEYNEWSNWDTWAVSTNIAATEELYKMAMKAKKDLKSFWLKNKNKFPDYKDVVVSKVNWEEVLKGLLDENISTIGERKNNKIRKLVESVIKETLKNK